MVCPNCSRNVDDAHETCPYCGAELTANVRVMSAEEKRNYGGITIENEEEPSGREEDWRQKGRQNGVFVRQIRFGSLRGGWMMKLIIGLCVAAIASFFLFVFLPLALIAVAVGVVIWFILRMLR